MSCDCNDPCDNTTLPTSGTKISQLNTLTEIESNDLLVVVDVSNNETKNVDYGTIVHYDNSGASLTSDSFQEAITELDNKIDSISGGESEHDKLLGLQGGTSGEYYHLSELSYDSVQNLTSGYGTVPPGGFIDQVLSKDSDNDWDYSWKDISVSGSSSGIPDVPDDDIYLRTRNLWVQSDQFTSADYYNVTETNILFNDKEDYLGSQKSDGQVLASSGSDVRYWVDMGTGGFADVTSAGTYVRSTGLWVQSDQFDTNKYYNMVDTDTLLGDKADTSTVLLKDGSVELDSGYETSAAGPKGVVAKDFLEQSISTAKNIRSVDFVYAGGVNNDVILETRSSFNDRSGFYVPSSEYEVYVTGIRITASTSYNNGISSGVVVRLATLPVNHDKPFGFVTSPTTDNGSTVYENSNVLDGINQSGTKYNSLYNIVGITSPILLTPDSVLFCEFHPNFWTFTDVQISVIYNINRVV